MPQISVTLPSGAWSKEDKAILIQKLTAAMAAAANETGLSERIGVEDISSHVNVQIHDAAAGGYGVGGRAVG